MSSKTVVRLTPSQRLGRGLKNSVAGPVDVTRGAVGVGLDSVRSSAAWVGNRYQRGRVARQLKADLATAQDAISAEISAAQEVVAELPPLAHLFILVVGVGLHGLVRQLEVAALHRLAVRHGGALPAQHSRARAVPAAAVARAATTFRRRQPPTQLASRCMIDIVQRFGGAVRWDGRL